jgi:hypothetical protein
LVHELGADVNKADNWGTRVCGLRLPEAFWVWCAFFKLGAYINQPSCEGVTPLMVASIKKQQHEIVHWLVKVGADMWVLFAF